MMEVGPWIILFSVLVYGFIHSLLATLAAKARARQWFGPGTDRWYRLAYNFLGILTFLPVLALTAGLPSQRLYEIPTPWSYVTLAGQLLALLALGIGLLQTGIWTFLGFEQMLNPSQDEPAQMVTRGLYRWVRHPLYFATVVILLLWSRMTVNWAAFIAVSAAYFYLGSIPEEEKLVEEFGDAYRRYQQVVPRLVPRPGRMYRSES